MLYNKADVLEVNYFHFSFCFKLGQVIKVSAQTFIKVELNFQLKEIFDQHTFTFYDDLQII